MFERTKALASLGVFIIAGNACLAQGGVVNPCDRKNFYRPTLNDTAPFPADIQAAVFRLAVLRPSGAGGPSTVVENGTGYLIDKAKGYIITAAHVVDAAVNKPSVEIMARSPNLSLKLELFLSDDLNDIAVLKAKASDLPTLAQADIRALDIALRFRSPSFAYYTIGYPNGEDDPTEQKVQLEGADNNTRLLKVGQHVEPGSSGSPLIDDEGAVIGTLVNDKYMDTAEYRALVDVRVLLDQIPIDSEVQSLNRLLLNTHKPPDARFVQEFQWTSANPSNLELYEWVRHASGNIAGKVRELLTCPILPAYSDRLMVDAIPDPILASAPANVYAQLLLDDVDQAILLNRPAVALDRAKRAAGIFEGEHDGLGEARANISIGVANLYLRKFDDASKSLEKTEDLPTSPADKARTEVYLAQADAGRGNESLASRNINNVLPQLRQYGDRDGEAIAYGTLGRVAENEGDYGAAIKHFEKSRDLFEQSGNTVGLILAQKDVSQAYKMESDQPRAGWARKEIDFVRTHLALTIIVLAVVALAFVMSRFLPPR